MFIGREKELNDLNVLYNQRCFQCVIIYGQIRIGKTRLISEFVKDKHGIYFTALNILDSCNLKEFSEKIYKGFKINDEDSFNTWEEAFAYITEKSKENQITLVVDEFVHALKVNPSLNVVFQKYIDLWSKESKIFLILCSSNESYVEEKVLSDESHLYGKFTFQIRLEEFGYQEVFSVLGEFSVEDRIKIYASLGGNPFYLQTIDKCETYEENMKRLFYNISGFLYNGCISYFMEDIREPLIYNAILSAIACGTSKLGDIASAIGEERRKVSKYLANLMKLKVVERIYPICQDFSISRIGFYKLRSPSLYYWYRFVILAKAEIERGYGAEAANKVLFSDQLSEYIEDVTFKEICLQFLEKTNEKKSLPFEVKEFTRSYETNFDIMGENGDSILVAKCKWGNSVLETKEVEKLIEVVDLSDRFKNKYYYLFCRTPFPHDVLNMAKNTTNLILIRIKDK